MGLALGSLARTWRIDITGIWLNRPCGRMEREERGKMTHPGVVYSWEKCQELAGALGMTLTTNTENFLVGQGGRYLYVGSTIEGVRGYLEGYQEGRGDR